MAVSLLGGVTAIYASLLIVLSEETWRKGVAKPEM